MANEIIYAGGELDSLTVVSGSPSESGAVGDGTYVRRSVLTTDHNAIVRHNFIKPDSTVTTVVIGETLWVHCEVYYGGTANAHQILKLVDSSGQPWFAIQGGGASGHLRPSYNSGSGGSPIWTALGPASFAAGSDALKEFDIKITLGNPHAYEFYINRTLQFSGTFTQAALTEIAGVDRSGFADGTDCYWSQLLATRGIGTVGGKVRTRAASGAGTSNNFTSGVYTDINEATLNDATAMVSDTAGQKYTFAMEDVTVPSGYFLRSVFSWARGKNGGSAPNNFRHVIRSGGVDYESPSVANINSGYGPLGAQWATDPGGGNWDQSKWNAVELGGKSIT